MKTWNEKIFRKNDIRGIYKKDFDLSFVTNLARAFLHFHKQQREKKPLKKTKNRRPVMAVGHDCRLSSPEIAKQMAKSLAQAGAEVRFLGMVPSPLCFFAGYFMADIEASIMVTASHNPPDFNGFKLISLKETLCGEKILHLKKLIQEKSFSLPRSKGKITPFDIESKYVSFFKKQKFPGELSSKSFSTTFAPLKEKKFSKTPALKKKPCTSHKNPVIKKIAIDCGNGAGGPIAQKIFKALNLPIKIHWLYVKPDGQFPHHHPDPSLEKNLKDLKKTVKEKACAFGAALDGDGDRLVIVGKNGKTFHGDELMSVFISDLLKESSSDRKNIPSNKKNNFSVVVDVKCGDWFFDFLKEHKIPYTMWKSGHSLIRQKTLKKKALFGGELSGHFFFCDDYFPIDDGVYALLRLINICFKNNKNPLQLIPKKNSLETDEIRLATEISQAEKQLKLLKSRYRNNKSAHSSFIDGVRVSFPGKAWGLARLSNTQSEWTFRFGGKTKKNLQQIQKNFYRWLNIPD